MRIRESITAEKATVAVALALALGFSACGGSSDESSASHPGSANIPAKTKPENPITKTVIVSPSIHINYYYDGSREINVSDALSNDNIGGVSNVYEFCVGGNYYSETEGQGLSGANALSLHAARRTLCADGKLTPSDFSVPKTPRAPRPGPEFTHPAPVPAAATLG